MTAAKPTHAVTEWTEGPLRFIDAGAVTYARGVEMQAEAHARVLASRTDARPSRLGEVFLLEHAPPVITVSRRPTSRDNLLATPEALRAAGVEVAETDRGGDITYHGPGQLVAYPILDLQRIGWNLHGYMRALEEAVIRACARFGLRAARDAAATGVWVERTGPSSPQPSPDGIGVQHAAKVCAMGVRVRRWVSMHGLALNVTTNLDHFDLIVPCGLAGRTVTSLERELAERCPGMADVKHALAQELSRVVDEGA